ncbi:hypothetical protein AYL99_08344 [Fonsecaea erecta]|uniref:Aminoglycoside phosphotransferase domain-containing protein n=1 Tax=Fonsecaea erecta TaxID=1367422 RepID=A0A178ZDR5_9EURO|nr:hypothetical protein AYL99_08344 [Fonsecaea erecta]OAP57606.1 hypothetical protein AYL99_08344 [Fonsecaea erecta]
MVFYCGRLLSIKSAAEDESNLVLFIRHQRAAESFRQQLWAQKESIAALVKCHLNLRSDDGCVVLSPESWIQGGFNICVLVDVTVAGSTTRFVFRCPMPHKLAESRYPGTIDERVACEVAAYVYLQEHCIDVRTPILYAFGFVDGSQFTHIRQAAFNVRLSRNLWRWVHRILDLPLLSKYTRNTAAPTVDTAYMLLEYISPETGKMLSLTWDRYKDNANRTARLFQGMSRIMLSLARLPQTSIGSFRFNPGNYTITLTNRLLMCAMMMFENNGTPRTIQPDQMYQNTDTFVSDMLTLHDNHLLHDPHAVRDEDDARERMAIRTLLRAVSHQFINRNRRNGPFLLQLTDLHQSNVFVDDDWNVTCMLDLEWICALPSEMLSVPYWLTDCSIDNIIDDRYNQFDEARQVFLGIMDEEAKIVPQKHDIRVVEMMRDTWLSKGVWFWACIRSLNAWPFIFEDHILPRFSASKELVVILKQASTLWQVGIEQIVKTKVADEER